MKQCKRCDGKSLAYVTDYEHLNIDTESTSKDNGWLCDDCEAFHTDSYYEYEIVVNLDGSNLTKLK